MSNTTAKGKREERASLISQMNEIPAKASAENRAMTGDEIELFDKLDADQKSLLAEIETLERVERSQALNLKADIPAQRSQHTKRDADNALRAYFGKSKDYFNSEWRDAAQRTGFRYDADTMTVRLMGESDLIEARQQSLTASEGGNLVNAGIVQGFEKALKSYWSWQDLVTVRRTVSGEPYKIALNNDTANEGAYNDELTAAANVSMTFSSFTLNAYKITSGVFPISNELIQDSSQNLMAYVGDGLAERLGRKIAREVTKGDGNTGHLTGFVNGSTSAGLTFFKDGLVTEDLIDLYMSVDEAYRNSPKCGWMMHSSTLATVMKMNDSNGRPLYQAMSGGVNEAPRMMIYGKPVYINDYLDPIVPGEDVQGDKGVFFGDWSKVFVRIVRDVQIRTSVEKYFLEDAVAAIATCRVDSKLLNAGGNPIKHLVMNTASGAPSVLDE